MATTTTTRTNDAIIATTTTTTTLGRQMATPIAATSTVPAIARGRWYSVLLMMAMMPMTTNTLAAQYLATEQIFMSKSRCQSSAT